MAGLGAHQITCKALLYQIAHVMEAKYAMYAALALHGAELCNGCVVCLAWLQVSIAIKQLQRGGTTAFMGILKPVGPAPRGILAARFGLHIWLPACALLCLWLLLGSCHSWRTLVPPTSHLKLCNGVLVQIQEDLNLAVFWVNTAGHIMGLNKGKTGRVRAAAAGRPQCLAVPRK